MEAKAPVEAQHEESHVVAQANACAEGQVVKEVLKAEVAVLIDVLEKLHSIIRLGSEPHIAGIEEDSTVKVAEELLAILEVGHELGSAVAQQIFKGIIVILAIGGEIKRRVVAARTYTTQGEGAYAVGTTGIEHLNQW